VLKIGRYAVEREIGRGAMGVVYLAHDPVLDRRVAVKTVRLPEGLDGRERDEYLQRFYREAQAAGKLSHPGVVTIYDAGLDEAQGCHFIAMEYIAGVTLKQFFCDGLRPEPRQAAFIAAGVAEALDYAHAQGVVHRDVKPANIILTDRGAVKLADFGIAKVAASHLTTEGTYLGTPAYTSPEQVLGLPVDGRSDLFSLGIVLYELLTGQKPFPSDNLGRLFHAIAYEAYTPLREALPGCPPALARVIDRALHKEPQARYAAGAEMARDLRAFLDGRERPAGAEEPSPSTPPSLPPEGAEEGNPLDSLIAYLEETTHRLQPEGAPGPASPSAPPSPAGLRARALSGLRARPTLAPLARELPAARAWALAGLAALAASALLVPLGVRAREAGAWPGPPPGPVPSWREEVQAGRRALAEGDAEGALARLQRVRRERPASPALAAQVRAALMRLVADLQQALPADGTARRLQAMGESAAGRGDSASAAEFFQAALRVQPDNASAVAAMQALPDGLPPGPATGPGPPLVRLVFDSPVPRGYIMANVDDRQVLRKSFAFDGTGGRLEEPLAAAPGRHLFKVWVTARNGKAATAYAALEGTLAAGRPTVLRVRLDGERRKLSLELAP
jgi:serine/threonine protein kinase